MEIKKLLGRATSAFSNSGAEQLSNDVSIDTARENSEAAKSAGVDTVQVSSLARTLAQIPSILDDDAEERTAKIADIKKRLADGTYKVDSRDVAQSIIDNVRGSSVGRDLV